MVVTGNQPRATVIKRNYPMQFHVVNNIPSRPKTMATINEPMDIINYPMATIDEPMAIINYPSDTDSTNEALRSICFRLGKYQG